MTSADLGIDQLLFAEDISAAGTSQLGRMSPLCAVSFAMLEISLLVVHRSVVTALLLSLAILRLGALAALGHLYGVP